MKLRDLRRKLIDDYAVLPFLLCAVGQVVAFYVTRIINYFLRDGIETYLDMTTKADEMIPAVPLWTVMYILTFVFWVVSYLWVAKESREMCYKLLSADMLGKIVCAVIFLIIPSTNVRPGIPGDAVGAPLLELIYFLDTPDNLFPSMHCSISWLAARYVNKCRKIPKWYKALSWVTVVLVFQSVLFTKQHVAVDILGGVAVAEICTQISSHTGLYKFYNKLDVVGRFYERKDERKKN